MIYTIIIPNWHPTRLNLLLGNKFAAARFKRSDREIVAHYCKGTPKALGKRLVGRTIVLGKGQHGADVDAYDKSLLDALVHAGMLKDDSRKWVEISPVQYDRGAMQTILTLEDL